MTGVTGVTGVSDKFESRRLTVSSVSGVSGVSDKFESRRLTVSGVSGVSGRRFLAMHENSEQITSKLLHQGLWQSASA